MVYAQTDPPAVEPELPQVEYVWDLECRLLAAEVDLIFADALTPLHTESAPTVTTDVPGENMRPRRTRRYLPRGPDFRTRKLLPPNAHHLAEMRENDDPTEGR